MKQKQVRMGNQKKGSDEDKGPRGAQRQKQDPEEFPERQDDVRNRILARAMDLFYQKGINATGINQLISESAVAKDTFYRQFSSKEALVHEVVSLWGRRLSVLWERQLGRSHDAREFVKRWIDWEKKQHKTLEAYNGCPVAAMMLELGASASPEIRTTARQIEERWITFLKRYVAKFQTDGQVTGDRDPEQLAREILTAYQGALVMWRISGDVRYVDGFSDVYQRILGLEVERYRGSNRAKQT